MKAVVQRRGISDPARRIAPVVSRFDRDVHRVGITLDADTGQGHQVNGMQCNGGVAGVIHIGLEDQPFQCQVDFIDRASDRESLVIDTITMVEIGTVPTANAGETDLSMERGEGSLDLPD